MQCRRQWKLFRQTVGCCPSVTGRRCSIARQDLPQRCVPRQPLLFFLSELHVSASNTCQSTRQRTYCQFLSSLGVPVCPLRQTTSVLPVEIVVKVVYASGTEDTSDTRDSSPHRYRRLLAYVAINRIVASCRTYVSPRNGRILLSRVLVSKPLLSETTAQILVSPRPVALFLKGCLICRIKKSCRGFWLSWRGNRSERLRAGGLQLPELLLVYAYRCRIRRASRDNRQLHKLVGRRQSWIRLSD